MLKGLLTGLRLTIKAIRDIHHLGPSRMDLLRRAGTVLLHPREHIALTRILAQEPVVALTRERPRLTYKYVWPYLANRFNPGERRQILAAHHSFLAEHLSPGFFTRLVQGALPLWALSVGKVTCEIVLDRVEYPDTEGELALVFLVNGTRVYRLAFTIVPGAMAGADVEHALFVGGVQGAVGQYDAMRAATSLCDATPPILLLAAASGVARALGIDVMAGVTDAEHVSKFSDPSPDFNFSYDRFFLTAGGALHHGLYHFPAALPDDDAAAAAPTQRRRRIRARRAFRRGVSEAAQEVLQRECIV